jgi:two-component system CheB/CheR fusion protein
MVRALRLLVVEDHDDTAELLAELLGQRGHSVRVARSVSEALELVQAEVFDVVLSDVGLPDASGYDLMEKLRGSSIKGIVMTGWGRQLDIERGRAAGFSAHLTKPVSLRRLEETLAQLA